MQTVVEAPTYLKAAETIFTDGQRAAIITMLAIDPRRGDVMPGTGGFRKMRVGRSGIGKRGGARVIYIFREESLPVFLIMAYAKNDKANITQAEANQLRKRADEIFAKYSG